jgi:hypothetical protein
MTSVRYVGTASWTRVLTKDDGTFDKMVAVKPGDVVDDLDKDTAEKLSDPSVPRSLRSFVVANSDEDPYKDDYEEPYNDSSNPQASDIPKLDMGSTRPGGEPQFELTAEQKAINERQAKAASRRAELGDKTPNAEPKNQKPEGDK